MLALATAGCSRPATPPPPPRSAVGADTVRGIVAVTGADPQWRITLTTAGGVVHDVRSAGGSATSLDELKGADHLEVTLLGDVTAGPGELPGARGFRMTGFVVRAADGADAMDGILVREPSGYGLRLMDGTTLPIAALPKPLTGQVGARIFWVGPTDLLPAAYGVLRARAPLRPPGR
ncbi:MAG: hypothetical protein KJT01_03755 [Gemmatimonadetes bacterium]|nr:hypothetical protein [Gemmatimonadota bacterium]